MAATATAGSSAPSLLRDGVATPLPPAATLLLSMPTSRVSLGHFLLLHRLSRVMLLMGPGRLSRWPRHRPCRSHWDDYERSWQTTDNIVYQEKTGV